MAEQIEVQVARLEEKFTGMAKDIHEIKKLLKGNGNPGLVKKVADLDTKLAEQKGAKQMLGLIFGSSAFTGVCVFGFQKIFP